MNLRSIGSWSVIGGLTLLAIGIIYFGNLFSLQGEITGALAGGLIAGAAVILGGNLERAESRRAAQAKDEIFNVN